VENAIYHGLKPKRGTGTLTLRGYPYADRIRIEVMDDGVGMDAHTLRHLLHLSPARQGMDSFGISSVHTRLQLSFGETAGIQIESVEQAGTNDQAGTNGQAGTNRQSGTKVTVTIPVIKAYEREPGKEADT
jgi:sensor histidine kinase YesM